MITKPIRILIAKPGLDGHDRGAKVVAIALRNAGFEVIYTGLHQTIDQIFDTALEEDVDVIGLSILSGAHLPIAEKLMAKLKQSAMEDKLVLIGGNIPERDIPALKDFGVAGVFPTGSSFDEIASFIQGQTLKVS
jgi:methylmalonyl-CoA mutase C-terminal domain/subunit